MSVFCSVFWQLKAVDYLKWYDCRRLHHIYTIIITGMIIHVFVWHPMLVTIAIASHDCDTGWSNYNLAGHHHVSSKFYYNYNL